MNCVTGAAFGTRRSGGSVKLGGYRGAKIPASARKLATEAIRHAASESLRAIARLLNERGIPTAHGKQWPAVQVARLKARVEGDGPFEVSAAA